MSPTPSTLKKLFALSGNRCAFPKCHAPLTHNDTLLGEVCHIKADKSGGARYDALQTHEERHAQDNLIILCPTHHTVVDSDEEAYTVERLRRMKLEHEANVTSISEAKADKVITLALQQNVENVGQNGGLSAHTILANAITVNSRTVTEPLAIKRQIAAIEALWSIAISLRHEFGDLIMIDTILTRDEIKQCFLANVWPSGFGGILVYSYDNTIFEKFERANASDSDKERPFISHRLWSVYYIIRALYGRIALLFRFSFEKKIYQDWRDDDGVDQLLRVILTPSVINELKSSPVYGLQYTFDNLEAKFLAEAKMNRE